MTQHSVGDKLASGAPSAQFSTQAGISDFENDLIFRPEIVAEKYGLTEIGVGVYKKLRENGRKLPDLPTKVAQEEAAEDKKAASELGYVATDKTLPLAVVVEALPLKYLPKEYASFKPVLDRVLVKRTTVDPNMEELSDGSLRDKKTGFVTLAAYREHQKTGHVLAVGDFVVMGGVKTPLSEILLPGDRVMWGDYNSEIFVMPEEKVEALCDSLGINYVPDAEGLRIVRVQDIRGVERPIDNSSELEAAKFREGYNWVDRLPEEQKKAQRKNPIIEAYVAGYSKEVVVEDSDSSAKDGEDKETLWAV